MVLMDFLMLLLCGLSCAFLGWAVLYLSTKIPARPEKEQRDAW